MRHFYFSVFLSVMLLTPAWADDAVEAAATGNIIFEKAPEIIMQDETLTITKSKAENFGEEKFSIDVDFHFKNTSDHDITRKIAFALPPVRCQMDFNTLWAGLESKGQPQASNGLKDFTVTVDGKSVTYTKKTDALLGQTPITDLLNKLNIPLNPCQIHTQADGSPDPQYRDALQQHHLLTENNEAAWTENIYFDWVQTFPAGKVINIHHHYTPVIGMAVPAPRPVTELNTIFHSNKPPFYPLWNRNPATLAQTNANIIDKHNVVHVNSPRFCVLPEWIRYRLTTGAYWAGGIGLFKLIIKDEAGAPFAVNEFFAKNVAVQKTATPTSMTVTIKDFIPRKDLLILFLALPRSEKEFHSCGMGD